MDPLYKPQGVENRWQQTWEEEGLYNADPDPTRESWVYCSAAQRHRRAAYRARAAVSLGDVLRMERMQGLKPRCRPGYDHAGISTQNVVET